MQAVSRRGGYLSGSVRVAPRKSGDVWEARYRLPSGKDSTKVLGRVWTGKGRPRGDALTEAMARAKLRALLDEHAETTPSDRQTLGHAVAVYLHECEVERDLAGGTIRTYRSIAAALCDRQTAGGRRWRDRPLDSFRAEELIELRNELVEAKRAPNTINQYRVVVRAAWGVRSGSPALAWGWKAARKRAPTRLRFYNPAEVARLVAAAGSEMDAAIFTLAAQAGPRMSEIRGLLVENVDFANRIVRFRDGFTDAGGDAGTKTRNLRSVPMSRAVAKRLHAFCDGKSRSERVFTGESGGPVCGSALYRRFVAAARKAALPRITFHELRHSFGTQAIQRFDIYAVARMMGHASITTTEKYLHYRPDPAASALMDTLWSTGPSGQPSDRTREIVLSRAA